MLTRHIVFLSLTTVQFILLLLLVLLSKYCTSYAPVLDTVLLLLFRSELLEYIEEDTSCVLSCSVESSCPTLFLSSAESSGKLFFVQFYFSLSSNY